MFFLYAVYRMVIIKIFMVSVKRTLLTFAKRQFTWPMKAPGNCLALGYWWVWVFFFSNGGRQRCGQPCSRCFKRVGGRWKDRRCAMHNSLFLWIFPDACAFSTRKQYFSQTMPNSMLKIDYVFTGNCRALHVHLNPPTSTGLIFSWWISICCRGRALTLANIKWWDKSLGKNYTCH